MAQNHLNLLNNHTSPFIFQIKINMASDVAATSGRLANYTVNRRHPQCKGQ